MKQIAIYIFILILTASCEPTSSNGPSGANEDTSVFTSQADDTSSSETITVFLTGNTLGSLKPCGCTGGQLGGLDRRPEILNSVPEEKRLIVDTGSIVEKSTQQDLIKLMTILQAYSYMKYDIVNLTEHDLEVTQGLLDGYDIGFISPYSNDYQLSAGSKHQFTLNGEDVNVSVVAFDPEAIPVENLTEVFKKEPDKKNVNILILNDDDDETISQISQLGIVDCIVCMIRSDEPTLKSQKGQTPVVCSVGRYGRHISRLEIKSDSEGQIKLAFDYTRIEAEIKQNQTLKNLYKQYQDSVKDFGLLEKSKPNLPTENGLKYVGSQSCKSDDCHSEPYIHQFEFVTWSDNPKTSGMQHSHAYETLVEVGSQYDPECIVCHVVGYKYETGFISYEETPHLVDVGCEVCHGPGSAHNEDPYKKKTTTIKDKYKLCIECHSPEHDGSFAGNKQEKYEIIYHGPEPNAPSDVK